MFHLAAGMRRNHSGAKGPENERIRTPRRPGSTPNREEAAKLTRTRRTGKFCQVAPGPAEKPELVRV